MLTCLLTPERCPSCKPGAWGLPYAARSVQALHKMHGTVLTLALPAVGKPNRAGMAFRDTVKCAAANLMVPPSQTSRIDVSLSSHWSKHHQDVFSVHPHSIKIHSAQRYSFS